MDFELKRQSKTPDGIFSILRSSETPNISFWAAEHSYNGEPKLVDGTYTCRRYLSPKHGYELFVVEKVPNATMIEIHVGNKLYRAQEII